MCIKTNNNNDDDNNNDDNDNDNNDNNNNDDDDDEQIYLIDFKKEFVLTSKSENHNVYCTHLIMITMI